MLRSCYQYSKISLIDSMTSLRHVELCDCLRLCFDFHTRTFSLILNLKKKRDELLAKYYVSCKNGNDLNCIGGWQRDRKAAQTGLSFFILSESFRFIYEITAIEEIQVGKSTLVKSLTLIFFYFVNTWYLGCKSNPQLRASPFSWHIVKLPAKTSEMRKRILTLSLAKLR
jgi:hypothetical protein